MIQHNRPQIGTAEMAAVERVLSSGQLAQGVEVDAFESEFADLIGSDHAVAVANGTVAIEVGLAALGIGPGDEVIVPSFTFVATANAVRQVGARPVFADIDPKTFSISAATVEPVLTPATRAVIAVHLYGHPADVDGLSALCLERDLHLIEDSAQGIGTAWRGQNAGTFGIFGTFSFYATKNLTTGEGGMITTSDASLADAARTLRTHGSIDVDQRPQVGTNARMTDIAAAIGRAQLRRLPEMQARRADIAEQYNRRLPISVSTPHVASEATHGYHLYTIRVPHREKLIRSLDGHGVGYGVYYPQPCHRRPEYSTSPPLAETDAAASEVLSIPIRPDLTAHEQEIVIAAVTEGVEGE